MDFAVIALMATATSADYLDADSESIDLGLTQNRDTAISLLTARAGFDRVGWRLTLPRIQPMAERFDKSHSSRES